MTTEMAHGEAELPAVEHKQPAMSPRDYVIVGLILTVITAIELWVSYSALGGLIVPVLLVLSAVKFAIVVAFFMHLRFDNVMLTRFFVFGLALAAALLVALVAMFWNDATTDARSTTAVSEGASGGAAAAAGGFVVSLKEFTIEAAATVAAGDVTFDVRNDGTASHNLRVIKTDLAPDALPMVAGAVDETQLDVVATTSDLAPGRGSESVTATLEAGTYVLICNVVGHYQLGMHMLLTVQ
jgi:cytochrome c oxidase subunit 4